MTAYIFLHAFELTLCFLKPLFTDTDIAKRKCISIDMFYSTDKKSNNKILF